MSFLTASESNLRPIRRLMAKRVFSGLVTAWRLACWPTRRSPLSVMATIDGVVRLPSELAITTGSPPSMMATQELVVPRSIPITLLMTVSSSFSVLLLFKLVIGVLKKQGAAVKIILAGAETVTMAGRSSRSLSRYPFWYSSTTVLGGYSSVGTWAMAWWKLESKAVPTDSTGVTPNFLRAAISMPWVMRIPSTTAACPSSEA